MSRGYDDSFRESDGVCKARGSLAFLRKRSRERALDRHCSIPRPDILDVNPPNQSARSRAAHLCAGKVKGTSAVAPRKPPLFPTPTCCEALVPIRLPARFLSVSTGRSGPTGPRLYAQGEKRQH